MTATGTEARVCQDIAERQLKGTAKYGTTVEGNPLGMVQWIRHAYEECLDQAVYLRRCLEVLEGAQSTTLEDGSVLTATGPQSGQGSNITELSKMIARGGDAGLYVTIQAGGGGIKVRSDGWGQAVGAPTYDPHAELRKTWKPGQVWQFRHPEWLPSDRWCDVVGDPVWHAERQYRRHPDDVDQEKPWYPDSSGDWVEVPDDCMECPIKPSTKVFVLLRCDRIKKQRCGLSYAAGDWGWDVDPRMSGRIVAYKVVA